jgi:selenide,water dikinase
LSARTLAQVLRPLKDIFSEQDYPNLLSGLQHPDDAAVWRLDEDRALLVTTDFFTPVVDDAYDYGAIAAANSLSDIYAMGGIPFLGLNITALPAQLPLEIVNEILRGGAEIAREAGVVIAGGHTIQDNEPKYGLVVLGFAHPRLLLTKGGAQPGDSLLLSKPIGSGVITSALKAKKADPGDVAEAVIQMKQLNKTAGELAVKFGAHAATDITGFGLLGHAWEMASASGVGLHFHLKKIPLMLGAERYAAEGTFPGGAFNNADFFGPHILFAKGISHEAQMLLFDPQTSGGILMALPPEQRDMLLQNANESGQTMWLVGEVVGGESGIEVDM